MTIENDLNNNESVVTPTTSSEPAPLPWSENTEKLFDEDLLADFNIDKNHIDAKILADSINTVNNKRLITVQVKVPRYILAEVNTHRVFSRNYASSRAIPAKVIRGNITNNMFRPVYWGSNQRGMSASSELKGWRKWMANKMWGFGGHMMAFTHWSLEKLGLHKQTCNRLLEPWNSVYGVITATEWENFMRLRYNKNAQPEIICLAKAIHDAIINSVPRKLQPGEYHLPYITDEERKENTVYDCIRASVARCCRVSYKNRETGKPSVISDDIKLYDRLLNDHHFSPFEHIGFVPKSGRVSSAINNELQRNFRGWYQFRAIADNEENREFWIKKGYGDTTSNIEPPQ